MPGPFSEVVFEHFQSPRNLGTLPDADGEGCAGSLAAFRWMRVQVRLERDVVGAARFSTTNCVPAIAAGSWLTAWATGRAAAEARTAGAVWLRNELGGLPAGREFCADLAVEALRLAVDDALERRKAGE